MRILHVVDSGGIYGKERAILELMTQQAQTGLVPMLGSITRRGEEKPILRAAWERGLDGMPLVVRSPGDPWRVRGAIAERQVDLVHTHDYKGSLILAPLRRWRVVPPLVRTLHRIFIGGFSKLRAYETLDRWVLRWHDAVVAVTADIRAQTSVDLTLIQCGISPPANSPAGPADPDLDTARAFCRDDLVLGAIARLSPEKNLEALLEAVAVLNRGGLLTRLIVLGEGRSRRMLEEQAQRLGIADRVWMPGFKPDVQPWFELFHFYVQASFAEGLPISLLEAMHTGVPLLVTPVAGMKDLLASGAAIEIPFKGPAIAEVVRAHWMEEPARAKARAVAVAARQLVRTTYRSERMATEYTALYRRVLAAAQPG